MFRASGMKQNATEDCFRLAVGFDPKSLAINPMKP